MNYRNRNLMWWVQNCRTTSSALHYLSIPGLGLCVGLIGLFFALAALAAFAPAVSAHAAVHHIGPTLGLVKLVEKRNELAEKSKALKKVFDEAGPDRDFTKVKSLGENLTTVSVLEKVKAMNKELDALGEEIEGLAEIEQIAGSQKARELAQAGIPQPGADPERERAPQKSLGQMFTESPAFKNFHRGSSQGPVAPINAELKTLMTESLGWTPQNIRTGIVTTFPTRPAPVVVNFIPQTPTDQAAIVYMEETTYTNNAAEVTEGSTYGEAALALTERSQSVRKIGVFLPVTDEQLEDIPQIQSYIDNRLVFMIQQRLDAACLTGNGLSSALLGTENVTNIQTQALGNDSIPDAIFKLFVSIRSLGFAEPGVVFIPPAKWQNVALLKTADGLYIWGHPSESGPTRIWGIPVVQTTAGSTTKATAGDYAMHSMLAIKRGIDMQISNSHSTYFIQGQQAIRADMRVAMVHIRPQAFGCVTGL